MISKVVRWQWMVAIVALSVFFLDQFSKYVAQASGLPVVINTGISFGWRPAGEWLTIGLLVVASLFATTTYRYWRRAPLAAGLFLGGTCANIFDRLVFGGVRDWLPVPLLGLYNNVADWGIAIAVLLLMSVVMHGNFSKKVLSDSH